MATPDPWPTGQTLKLSLIEAVTSAALATLTSVVLQRVIYPGLGIHIATETTVAVAGFYGFWVFFRQFVIRRIFNRVDHPWPDGIDYGLDDDEDDEQEHPPGRVIVGKIITEDKLHDPDSAPQYLRTPSRNDPLYDPGCPACDLLGRPCAGHRTGSLEKGERA